MLPNDTPLDLRALHIEASNSGRRTLVLARGDAEEQLWRAPRVRVLRRQWRLPGVLASELHALLDVDGRPLAWWQCSVAAAWSGAPRALPVPHLTLHEIAHAAPGTGPAGDEARERCLEAFIETLAQVAGIDSDSYRRAWRLDPARRFEAVAPAHPHAAGA
jgi:hypothetical protein